MAIETILEQVAVLQAEITGVKQAHEKPPSSLNALPCFVSFIGPARINRTPSRREIHHTVMMQLYVTKQVLPQAEALLRPFISLTLDKFDENIKLNNTCAYSMITGYDPGELEYNRSSYLGITFELLVVEHEAPDYAA